MTNYVTHARTPEQLKAEFISHIRQRLSNLDYELNATKSAGEKAKISRAIFELENMMKIWDETVIIRPTRRKP